MPGRDAAGRPAGTPGAMPLSPAARRAHAAQEEDTAADVERELDALAAGIQQLRIAYQRYFAGDLPLPPEEQRRQIDDQMRRLRSLNMRRPVDRFRFGSLEAQLSSYGEMYQRRLRAVEEGRGGPRRTPAPAPAIPVRLDVAAGVVVDSRPSHEAVTALFEGLRSRNPATSMDLDTFGSYLSRQVAEIQNKTGCSTVQFRLVEEEGKVKLKAKPIK
jgi:hypothetical protein